MTNRAERRDRRAQIDALFPRPRPWHDAWGSLQTSPFRQEIHAPFELGRLYTAKTFERSWARFLTGSHVSTFDVPVEVVVRRRGQIVTPKTGRGYATGCVRVEVAGRACVLSQPSHEWLGRRRDAPGIVARDEVTMYEVWQDHGDDGHTSYRLDGWIFLSAVQVETLCRALTEERAAWGGEPPTLVEVIQAFVGDAPTNS